MRRLIFVCVLACLVAILPFGSSAQTQLPSVDPATVTGNISMNGSPVLSPVTTNILTIFALEGYSGTATVNTDGTDTAFQQLCSGEIDIVLADRGISPQEVDACTSANRPPIGFRVATSAVIVAVSNQNTFANNLTTPQLQQIFSTALSWSEVNPNWTTDAIQRSGSPTDSTQFDLFASAVFGGDRNALITAIGAQYNADQGGRLQTIATSTSAIGFFDATYALDNSNLLQGVTIDGVAPSAITIADTTYPLSRPLTLYTTSQDFTQDPQVASFINYYLTNIENEITAAGLFRAPAGALETSRNRWLSASGQTGISAPPPVATEEVSANPLDNPPSDVVDIAATATALAQGVFGTPSGQPTPIPALPPTATPIPQLAVDVQNSLIQSRLDLELVAQELAGDDRPIGWSGSLDIENPQLPVFIRLDLEVLAAGIYGIENRPDDWFGAVRSTQDAIARDIRHDLELLADDVFGNSRPTDWVGGLPIARCDRSTQALAVLLERNGLYSITSNPESPTYCQDVTTELSSFTEVNLLSTSPVSVGPSGVEVPADVTIETTIAVAFYNTSATRRAGVVPSGTGIEPIARSYLGFSNMTLIRGTDFLLFVEWQNTSLTQAEWRELPDVADLEVETTCTTDWCVP